MNFLSLFKRKLIYNFKKKINIDLDNVKLDTLDDLFHFYGSDKSNIFKNTGKSGHGYSKFYEEKLEKLKNKEINILEIGSFAGASAAAFVKYFHRANVYCFDINVSNFKYKSKNIHVFGIDINDKNKNDKTLTKIFTKNNFKEFDIIIDDGSHNLSDILKGFKFFFKFLKKGGIYIIEDFKLPNYYEYNRNIEHLLVDEFLKNINNKVLSKSSILTEADQKNLIEVIEKIENFKGNLRDSDICFISKN